MRKKALFGVGLALVVGGTGLGQQLGPGAAPAVPLAPRAQVLPSGLSPAAPTAPAQPVAPAGGYVPPTSGLQPAVGAAPGPAAQPAAVALLSVAEFRTALPADHPWVLKGEHGLYFIMVKSYVRPAKGQRGAEDDKGLSARELAEGLAAEIRDTYRVQAFLFEYVSEERKAEMRQIAEARQKAQAYKSQLDALRQKSQLQGMEFLEPDNKLHVMTHNHRDQIGVLVGGFQTAVAAKLALEKLKTWPTPKNEILCDKGVFVQPGADGKPEAARGSINPYKTAFVVPNPASAKAAPQARGLDPFIVKLNDDRQYNLLKTTKGWTLQVKTFSSPVEIVNKDSDTSLMRKVGLGKGADVLAAGAEQAESMAKVLRSMKTPFESYVLHTRNSSIVTVGQFDGPDDPSLVATRKLLLAMKIDTFEDKNGQRPVTNAPTALFENVVPMVIPR
ncbi:MAG: hypothetical protein ACKODX_18060 [Gemmata sp.]